MELYDVMRTTFSARDFTDDPLPDETLFKILDNARFASSGGNRQGWHVIIIRDSNTREQLSALTEPAAKRYVAQIQAGESPWNSVDPTSVSDETIAQTQPPARLTDPVRKSCSGAFGLCGSQSGRFDRSVFRSGWRDQRRLHLSLCVEHLVGGASRRIRWDAHDLSCCPGAQNP